MSTALAGWVIAAAAVLTLVGTWSRSFVLDTRARRKRDQAEVEARVRREQRQHDVEMAVLGDPDNLRNKGLLRTVNEDILPTLRRIEAKVES